MIRRRNDGVPTMIAGLVVAILLGAAVLYGLAVALDWYQQQTIVKG